MAIKFGKSKVGAAPAPAARAAAGKAAGKAAAANNGAAASLLPEDFVSGGLLNDVDVTITDMTFVDDWTYNGAVADPVLALRVTYVDDDQQETIQHYSAGDLARWIPSEDGKQVVPAQGSTAQALNNNTNCAALLASIMEAGFPKKMVSNRVDVFEGTNVHVTRVPQQKRSGIVSLDDKQRDVLIVSKINALPGEEAPKKAAPSKAAPGKAAPAKAAAADNGAGDDEAMEAAAIAVAAVLEDKGGSVAGKALPLAILKHLAGNPHRTAIIALVKNPNFLGAEGVPWQYDGTTVSAEA